MSNGKPYISTGNGGFDKGGITIYSNPGTITAGDQFEMPDYDWNNQDFAKMAQNNPYLQYQYTPSLWDNLFRNTGIKTREKAWIDQQKNDALGYDAMLQEADRQQAYNEADEQAQRMRDAGLNPNLDPGTVEPGEAAENDNQVAERNQQEANDIDMIKNGLSVATSMIGTITNVYSTASTIMLKGKELNLQEYVINRDTRTKVYEIMKHIMEGHYESDEAGNEMYPWNKFGSGYVNSTQMSKELFLKSDWVKDMFPTKKEQDWAWRAYEELKENYEVATTGRSNLKNYENAGLELGQTQAIADAWGGTPDYIRRAYKPIAEFLKKTNKILAEAGLDEAKFAKSYYAKANGEDLAVSHNNLWQYQGAYYANLDPNKSAKAINTSNDLYIALNGAWSKLLMEINRKASDENLPWYEKMMYLTELKVLGDVQGTNMIQGAMNFVPSILPKTTTTSYMHE